MQIAKLLEKDISSNTSQDKTLSIEELGSSIATKKTVEKLGG